MMERILDRTPALGAVVREQVRAVGLAVRREAIALVILFGVPAAFLTVLILVPNAASIVFDSGQMEALTLDPGEGGWGILAAGIGLLCPLAVWKGERIFGYTQLWSLPVAHRRHALIKVGAGWVWLMTFLALGFVVLAAVSLLSGGSLGGEETRLLVPDPAAFMAGQLQPDAATWHTAWWQWVMPFTGATAAYLLTSALALGARHPWHWVAGFWVGFLMLGILGEMSPVANGVFETVVGGLIQHPLGLDSLLTGGVETLSGVVKAPSGDTVRIWIGLPTLGRWAAATTLWLFLSAASLTAALYRHRER